MNSFLKQALLLAGWLVGGILVLVAWMSYSEITAKRRAEVFCNETPIGQSLAVLSERIAASKADERQSRILKENDTLTLAWVIFTGFTPISRHMCGIELEKEVSSKKSTDLDWKVTSKKIAYLD